jgi:hypothetical protein
MKNLILTFSILVLSLNVYSQSYAWISSYQFTVIQLSVEYTKREAENKFSYAQVLAGRQAQFDKAHREVSNVYAQMKSLNLLNKINQTYLNQYRDKYFPQIANEVAEIDLSIDQNRVWAIESFQKPIASNKYIRNEIKILNKLNKEIDFLENQAYKYNKEQVGDIEKRKKNISAFLTEFETADPGETQSLLKKHELYLTMTGEFLES